MLDDQSCKDLSEDVLHFIPALRAYAWTLTRSQQEIDDLVQETLTKAIANIGRFRPGTNMRAWLMTIMRNTFYNEIIKRNREKPGSEDCASASPSVQATQEWAICGTEIMQAVRTLPIHYREVLILVVMLGESYETTARLCGIAVGTVKSRVNRARVMVQDQLSDVDSSAS
ncbi:MAG: sigma-70 family RNA polymerase sigma factor [Pseudomonadota bacterium]|nr:sigma-70 family RNA polymerase sigma factor [Pseudomonadota bacterium]